MQLDFNHWLQQAITLLVIACPLCIGHIYTSCNLCSHRKRISKRSISKKVENILKPLASIKAIALDKTRTITFGNPIVSDIFPIERNKPWRTIGLHRRSRNIFSEHPLAQAIVDASRKRRFWTTQNRRFKSIMEKVQLQNVWCVNTKQFMWQIRFY